MGSLIVLILIVVAALLVVRAGAIALELTGMERDKAWFQALSAFTTTGFTSRETEEIMRYPARRRIVTVLIVLGYAGSVSVIATLVSTFLQRDLERSVLNLAVLAGALLVIFRLARWRGLTQRVRETLSRWLRARYDLQAPTLEEMLRVGEGAGVVRLAIREDSPLANRSLAELGLRSRQVQVLSIQRGETVIPVPTGQDVLLPGDMVICYGDVEAAQSVFAPRPAGTAANSSPRRDTPTHHASSTP